ncbi:helix-turn-helix transcriptional regulator [Mammaliicoccus sciuri]|uniref:AraC family transcriptional regulator n=1 Tax=Mammaliicoccus sciuri TaxID=1296 RepID=UPI0021CF502D|nr:AraC family transcriptional regulator [Mammaliicoccus sciuri]UXU83541.1 helix-turn-helix transcriptional regulator [Mammaliicoccus sciuri]UXU93388.1 helix-turn-helix transcriptional regulator [Mammaliicoccus sciuri]UXV15336.1 helix-turn-helix transcriptional regulator [Mammaliicoccus sciuri]UXV23601.1 helix-turn-helix transcriptional regulator [Mammaliicoccus sciuri]UXV26379.1 helix-turn-helix transcriptional regulator [Mammaliicoccus sciuri]
MIPKFYYLDNPMKCPSRAYDGLILVISLKGNVEIHIEGNSYNRKNLYIINESELYYINTNDVLLLYLPSSIFKEYNKNIFNQKYSLLECEELMYDLSILFKNYLSRHFHKTETNRLIKKIINSITKYRKDINSNANDTFSNITNYITNHLGDKITLKDLSQQFYMSTTSISTLFKNNTNLNYYEYTRSLRLSKSMKDIGNGKVKIESIARKWGYANTTVYIKHFKEEFGITPKKYRNMPIENKKLNIEGIKEDLNTLSNVNFDFQKHISNVDILINDKNITQPAFSFFNLIDIGGYNNLDLIINEAIFTYKNFNNYRLPSYIYISENIENFINNDFHNIISRLRKLLKTKFSVALKINSLKYYYFILKVIKELQILEDEHLSTSSFSDRKILLLLDLKYFTIDDIKHIKRDSYGKSIQISIDITEYYIKNLEVDSRLFQLSPDYFTIDFLFYDSKRTKKQNDTYNILNKSLPKYISKINVNKNVIILNYDNLYNELSIYNIGYFLENSISIVKYIAGASIPFSKEKSGVNLISIFDETENKTPFFFLGLMLYNFSKANCYYGDGYLITKNMYGYNILLYNSDDSDTNNIREYTKKYFIDFVHINSSNMIITSELLNTRFGSIDGIISSSLTERNYLPNTLKYKISQYNTPLFKVSKHNFKLGPFIANVPPKSVMMITIYH